MGGNRSGRFETIRIYETKTGKYLDEEDLSDRDGVSTSERILTARNAPIFAYGTSLFNSQTAELVSGSVTDDEPNYRVVDISADGKVVLAAYDEVYCAYEGEFHQLQLLSELKEPDERNFYEEFYAAALTDDGRFCAAANREKIFLVALFDNDGKFNPSLVDTLEGHLQTVDGLAFSRNGKLLASTSLDGSTRIWDVADLSKKD